MKVRPKLRFAILSLLHAVAPRVHAGAKSTLVFLQLPLLLRLRGLLLRGLLLLPLPASTDPSHHTAAGGAHRRAFSGIAGNGAHRRAHGRAASRTS